MSGDRERGTTLAQRHDNLIANARKLRRESTLPERLLWSRLRNHQLQGLDGVVERIMSMFAAPSPDRRTTGDRPSPQGGGESLKC